MRIAALALVGAVLALSAGAPAAPGGPAVEAQMAPAPVVAPPWAIPEERASSGTSWLPDASPVNADHVPLGAWTLMLHGAGFVEYDHQGGPRGASRLGIVNWGMLAGSRPLGRGRLELHGMLSAEPATIGGGGYPLLLQSGESYQGSPLHDRQHPHDLFMEVSGRYERPVSQTWGASLYLAAVGDPALGPVAFPHRPSAAADPLAPIGHHWQDATHITFGVVTTGLFTRTLKLEASLFNGREPDENRTDFDYRGRSLDSYGVRLAAAPGPHWALSAWYGYLKSPEELRPAESLHRLGAAVLTSRAVGERGSWSSALIYGANVRLGAFENSALLETNLDLDGTNVVFARAEYVRKSAAELVIPSTPPGTAYDVAALNLGYLRELGRAGPLAAGVGVVASLDVVPASLATVYGSSTPAGVVVYIRLRPPRLSEGMSAMGGMRTPVSR